MNGGPAPIPQARAGRDKTPIQQDRSAYVLSLGQLGLSLFFDMSNERKYLYEGCLACLVAVAASWVFLLLAIYVVFIIFS